MRISDWSSDVCSSDLDRNRPERPERRLGLQRGQAMAQPVEQEQADRHNEERMAVGGRARPHLHRGGNLGAEGPEQHSRGGSENRQAAYPDLRQVGARLVLIGGGYIGLEIAAVAAKLGLLVTVVEAEPTV